MAKKPQISVIERRLQGPDVFRTSSQPIALAEPTKWEVRWVNTDVHTEHLRDVIHNKGWVYAETTDLACDLEEVAARVEDGRIVRGERGKEVLMKMPKADYRSIQKAKSRENVRQTFGKKQVQDAMVAGVASEHGDRAAEFVARNAHAITVTDSRERVPVDE